MAEERKRNPLRREARRYMQEHGVKYTEALRAVQKIQDEKRENSDD